MTTLKIRNTELIDFIEEIQFQQLKGNKDADIIEFIIEELRLMIKKREA